MQQTKEMMDITTLIAKLNRSKSRKHTLKLNYGSRELISRTILELSSMVKMSNVREFAKYIESSKKIVAISYDEMLFLKKFIKMTLENYSKLELPWYKLFTRFMHFVVKAQYRAILEQLQ